jgi:hypothetical protein
MKTPWRRILLTASILTVGFALALVSVTLTRFKDPRATVVLGTVIMGAAMVIAALVSGKPVADKDAPRDSSTVENSPPS